MLAQSMLQTGDLLRLGVTTAYLLCLTMIAIYGIHRYWLVWLFRRHRADVPTPRARFARLPRVTVQLPLFNEGAVAERAINAACRLDYPAESLQIQVLDDSTDGSQDHVLRCVEHWQQRGIDIELRHRTDRTGFKAGALAAGLESATGEFITVLDADFLPNHDFLQLVIHHFTDPTLGMVQTCWGHLNRDDSLLTRCQAIFLDGHFIIEHTARDRSGRWINFNGTAGIWRRCAIDDAGGWHSDTLTEDVDLSYRAQLRGWTFRYLLDVRCPAELPPEINAFKSQQHRWTKGSIQTAIKLLPTILRSRATLARRLEAFFHLTNPMVYLFLTGMAALFYPAIHLNVMGRTDDSWFGVLLGLSLFAMGTFSASLFYIASQLHQGRSLGRTVLMLPALMALGVGVALNNARGCIEALVGHRSDFIRTPKYNVSREDRAWRPVAIPGRRLWMGFVEIGMGLYMLGCIHLALSVPRTSVSVPFLLLFAVGYFSVGIASVTGVLRARRPIVAIPAAVTG